MKKTFAWLLLLPMLLTACGAGNGAGQNIQQQYAAVATAEMEATVVAHMTEENREFTLQCTYDAQNGATTTILSPDELKGVSASITADGLKVTYNGTALSAGDLEEVCPANCLPWLLESLANGYLCSEGIEDMAGHSCHRLALETAATDGTKILCTAWIDQETLLPLYAEFAADDTTILTVTMQSFSCTMREE